MVKRTDQHEKKQETKSPAKFTDLISRIAPANFSRMVMKSGLTFSEQRELCSSFRALKA